jgi:signal transduction histidine kinase
MNQSSGSHNANPKSKTSDSASPEPGEAADPDAQTPLFDGDPTETAMSIPPDSDFSWAITALDIGRDDILSSWLEVARTQPFHAIHPDRAVSDDIPLLYDAVVEFLTLSTNIGRNPGSPIDHPNVLSAANSHARTRAEQGLQPGDVVTEFRLLRRAIWKGLRDQLGDLQPTGDIISAELLVNDAIDGAITIGLAALTMRIEEIREDFLISTIHEIRQPITAIKGLTQLSHRYLSRQNPEIEHTRTALAGIATQVDQLNETINFLIDVSRAALGQLTLRTSFVDLARLVPEIVQQNGMQQLRELRLTLPEVGQAVGTWDAERIRQVITNLLSNAQKYSPVDSRIEIEIQALTDQVEVLVRDYGMGIEADELPEIFHRYYRTARALDSDAEGSGIGLYLCAQIINAHGGTIWAESAGPEQGTTVRFILPRGLREQGP